MSFKLTSFLPIAILLFCVLTAGCGHFASKDVDHHKFTGTFAGFGREFEEPFGLARSGSTIYVSDGSAGKIYAIDSGELKLFASGLDTPSGIAFAPDGNLIVADTGSHTIKKISANGNIEIVAGQENIAGLQDGSAAESLFHGPIGITISNEGVIFVTDTYNDRIRMIKDDVVTTFAGSTRGRGDADPSKFDTPTGIALYRDGLLVADTANRQIKFLSLDGSVQILAGSQTASSNDGELLSVSFVAPTAITVSDSGQIFIADGNAIKTIGRRIFPLVETISHRERGYSDGNSLRAAFNRPSGLVVDGEGRLIVADSENASVRIMSDDEGLAKITAEQLAAREISPVEFKNAAEGRWPYDPPKTKRDIAGTLGEVRGEVSEDSEGVWYHNGLDIAGNYGETARFVRDEKVLRPIAAENFNTLRELIRMPTLGYIHIRLGRDQNNRPYGDPRFLFFKDQSGSLADVRVPRGSKFKAGEPIGTLNALNHVHLIAGKSGSEYNALAALDLPGVSDTRPPVIENVRVFSGEFCMIETEPPRERITINDRATLIVRAFDQMDGNPERRKLGVYRLGYAFIDEAGEQIGDTKWTISFEKMPNGRSVKTAYGEDSHSGATGVTIFNYMVSNRVDGNDFADGFLETASLEPGKYTLRVFVADYFGNITHKDTKVELIR